MIGGSVLYYFNKSDDSLNLELKNQTITFKSKDKIEITADLYMTENINAPFILLFHQAESGREEYITIAPKLNELGFNCMAIDQRSGYNKTNTNALAKDKSVNYEDAYVDLEAALSFVKKKIKPSKIIVWGSSYSSLLVFPLGDNYAKDIDGILAFSPQDYFPFNGKSVYEYAKNVKCPIFITSSKSESGSWKEIFEKVSSEKKVGFIPTHDGRHGSSALFDSATGYEEEYWDAVKKFLTNFSK
jgi:pimeloyl-ACP methyl ester carboxylesterase